MREKFITSLIVLLDNCCVIDDISKLEQELTKFISKYNIEYTGTELVPYTDPIPKAVKDYLVTKSIEGLSKKSLKSYFNILKRFFYDINMPIEQVDTIAIKVWLYSLQSTGISMRTVALYKTVISSFFNWCEDNDVLTKNPTKKITAIKYEKPQHHALSTAEMIAVRNACNTLREHVLIELLYSTGCRVGELIAIKKSDIDINTKTVSAYNFKSKRTKTVYLTEQCLFWLKQYLDTLPSTSNVLFPSRVGGKPIGVSTVESILRQIGERAGLPKGRLHPHILRHTLATDIVTNGGSLADAQHILDHKKIETTLIYAESSQYQLQETHRRCTI